MIRGLLYWIFGSLLMLILAFFLVLVIPFCKNPADFVHSVIRIWSKILLTVFCGVRIEVTGRENIDSDRNYIIVSNHRSYTDILIGSAVIPLQFRWLAKKSLFKIPVIGFGMKKAGYIPIVREKSISASRSLQLTKEVLMGGSSVWIFPEGTRTPEKQLGRFKRGAFLLANEAGKPILPVVIIDSEKIFYRPLIIRTRKVKVNICTSVYIEDIKSKGMEGRESIDSLRSAVRQIIQTDYDAHVSQTH